MPTRDEFATEIESFIGTPIAHMGRSENGVDCVGLIILAASRIGLSINSEGSYGLLPSEGALTTALEHNAKRISRNEVRRGDLVQVFKGQQARHVGVYVGENVAGQPLYVHAWGEEGSVKKAILSDRVRQVWSLFGLEDD